MSKPDIEQRYCHRCREHEPCDCTSCAGRVIDTLKLKGGTFTPEVDGVLRCLLDRPNSVAYDEDGGAYIEWNHKDYTICLEIDKSGAIEPVVFKSGKVLSAHKENP